ncbi:peptide deformylase, partial [Porticoccaceae bacterium]|nr:peptide deformylase [Porticoccaceae bacterium]
MAILKILEYPNPRLRIVAEPVTDVSDEIRTLIDNMFETMIDADGIGLAATQVDVHQQVIVMDLSEKRERGQARVENLEELVNACKNFEPEDSGAPVLPQFLDQVALDAGDRQADQDEDAVQLMTLHSAKGLEFPMVFLAGMEENLFPHKMSIDEPGRLEEERRLAYVGITRAMQKLTMTFAETRSAYGTESFNSVSRFIRDIPKDVVEEVRLHNSISRPTTYAGVTNSDEGSDTGFQLGQQVRHNVYGDGIILNFEGNGPR